jgi:hypothetical protein
LGKIPTIGVVNPKFAVPRSQAGGEFREIVRLYLNVLRFPCGPQNADNELPRRDRGRLAENRPHGHGASVSPHRKDGGCEIGKFSMKSREERL